MATSNRGLLTKVHKVLKKHYKPVDSASGRALLEQLLFACCLENTHYERAEQAFTALTEAYFDLNEVRVSTVKELAASLHLLPDASTAASNLKRVLQSVFETTYSFELEAMKKQNLGVAIKQLEKLDGATPFVVAYVTQTVLEGHSIPIDRGALDCLLILGIITESEAKKGSVPGLERAIPKNKGVEFGSLLHQLSADFAANPLDPAVHKILLEITSDAKDRLPKKVTKKPGAESTGASESEKPSAGGDKSAAKKKTPDIAERAPSTKKKPVEHQKEAPGAKSRDTNGDRTKPSKPASEAAAKRKPR